MTRSQDLHEMLWLLLVTELNGKSGSAHLYYFLRVIARVRLVFLLFLKSLHALKKLHNAVSI